MGKGHKKEDEALDAYLQDLGMPTAMVADTLYDDDDDDDDKGNNNDSDSGTWPSGGMRVM